MIIGGLQKTTLIDFPGSVACTVFLAGCNFRCPFCHNKDLVSLKHFKKSAIKPISQKEFFEFLQKEKILDGVCLTGGEPTLNKNLPDFIKKIKKLGYLVKLDTNGSNPKMLNSLIENKLIDYVAMDVKSSFDDYLQTIGIQSSIANVKSKTQNSKLMENIKKSIKIILKSKIDYEFRTTVVPGLHCQENLLKLAKELKNFFPVNNQKTAIHWFLQPFKPQNCFDPAYLKKKPFSLKKLKEILKALKKIIPSVEIRGGD